MHTYADGMHACTTAVGIPSLAQQCSRSNRGRGLTRNLDSLADRLLVMTAQELSALAARASCSFLACSQRALSAMQSNYRASFGADEAIATSERSVQCCSHPDCSA